MQTNLILATYERAAFADGRVFGDAGPYERIVGRAHFEVDPRASEYATIVDLEHAPRDASGRVAFAADFFLLRPAFLARGNRRLLVEFSNRGNKRALQFFNDARHTQRPAHAGGCGQRILDAPRILGRMDRVAGGCPARGRTPRAGRPRGRRWDSPHHRTRPGGVRRG